MHKPNHRSLAIGAGVIGLLALVWVQQARSQINASPVLRPIGVSASGNTSTAWFHEPSSGQAVACRTVEGQGSTLSGIQCVTARLP
jgi:hypothetical protein